MATERPNNRQIDTVTIQKISRALGIKLGIIPESALAQIDEKVKELDSLIRPHSTDDPNILTGDILTEDLASKVRAIALQLPPETQLRDLKSWSFHPRQIPEWASLMLGLSTKERREITSALGSFCWGDYESITLGDLGPDFDITKVNRLGKQRELFFVKAFVRENAIYRPIEIDGEPDSIDSVDHELWNYALEHKFLYKMVTSGKITQEEIAQLEDYFMRGIKGVTTTTMDKFTLAVAWFA